MAGITSSNKSGTLQLIEDETNNKRFVVNVATSAPETQNKSYEQSITFRTPPQYSSKDSENFDLRSIHCASSLLCD